MLVDASQACHPDSEEIGGISLNMDSQVNKGLAIHRVLFGRGADGLVT